LLWAFKNASGDETSFEDAYAEYLDNERKSKEEAAVGEGKAKLTPVPNRSDRRAHARASGRKSASTSR
jgi:hypothetical protein